MKAVLMAAGVGSRISRTIDRPKSTLEVGGEPLIRRTVRMLTSRGIEVAVVLGFEEQFIRDVLKGCNVEFFTNPFYRVTNSMASLWFARDFMGDDTLILANADVYWDEDVLDELLSDEHPIVMLGDESRVEQGDYFFKTVNGYIMKYGKELAISERNTEYVGIARIDGSITESFRRNLEEMVSSGMYDLWWENVLYSHIDEHPVFVHDISSLFWAEIDYIDDYGRIKRYVDTGDISCKHGLQ